jgi:plastocyanin
MNARGRSGPSRRALRRSLLAVALFLAAACGGSSVSSSPPGTPPPNAAVVVDLHNVAFNPQSVTVHVGQTVAWKFDDGPVAHNVTGDGWASSDRTSGYYTHTFNAAGTYAYRCTIHSNMTGQVVVTP